MSVCVTITANDRDNDGDSVSIVELDPDTVDTDRKALAAGHVPAVAVVKVVSEGTPYLSADDLLVLAEQLRDLHRKIVGGVQVSQRLSGVLQ